jgi:4-aminobutyrate aminotransferase-like enzyme
MRRQMETMTFAPPLHGISDVALDFVEKVDAVTPGNLKYVKAFSGGWEATEAAMKFVRQYFKQTGHPGKYKFISRYWGYRGGAGARKTRFEPHMPGFLKVFPPSHYRDRCSSWGGGQPRRGAKRRGRDRTRRPGDRGGRSGRTGGQHRRHHHAHPRVLPPAAGYLHAP